jgi:hypothetical protein
MSRGELVPQERELQPQRELSTPLVSAEDWEALRAGCERIWPELAWVLYNEGTNLPSITGRKKRGEFFAVFQILRQGEGLCVFLTSPKPLPKPWKTLIYVDLALKDVPAKLPGMLAQGRAWWALRKAS